MHTTIINNTAKAARLKARLDRTWFGQAAALAGRNAPLKELARAAKSDVYFLRLIALAQLADSREEFALRRELGPEHLELLRLFQVALTNREIDPLSDVHRQAALHPFQFDLVRTTEQYLQRTLNSRYFRRAADGRSYWDFVVPEPSHQVASGPEIINRVAWVAKEVPLTFLWQSLHDLNIVSRKLEQWQDSPRKVLTDLCGPHLAEWRTNPRVQELLAGFSTATDAQKVKIAGSLTSLPEFPKDRLPGVGAIMVDAAGQIIGVGHNAVPLPTEFRPDCEVWGFFPFLISGKRVRTVEFGLRRSICAEQRSLLSAVLNDEQPAGATVYASLGPPCYQCLITLVNAGVKRIIYPLSSDRGHGATGAYEDRRTRELLFKLNVKPTSQGAVGAIDLGGIRQGRR
ncbi:MAG: hypothetical protein JW873_06350 [Candidatus Saganbacteria bacterium]|nr:hypothetical protein [Candidatus Saganbacteria bacterium]